MTGFALLRALLPGLGFVLVGAVFCFAPFAAEAEAIAADPAGPDARRRRLRRAMGLIIIILGAYMAADSLFLSN